jgi:hypothetical protein
LGSSTLEGEAHGLGVERLTVVEDHAAAELELPGRVVQQPPGLGQLGDDAVVAIPADQRVEQAGAHRGADRREIHRRVEVLRRPRDRHAQLAAGIGRAGQRRSEQ